MDNHQERQFVEGLRAGKTEAWQALYDAYALRVWQSVARLMGSDASGVADVVQETLMAAARSAGSYDPARGPVWVWLSGIARHHVALHCRRQQRHDRIRQNVEALAAGPNRHRILRWLENKEDDPAEALATAELGSLVRATLTKLPDEYQSLLAAKYLDGVSVEQIARGDRSTSTAVRSKLARARRAFRRAFEKDPGDS